MNLLQQKWRSLASLNGVETGDKWRLTFTTPNTRKVFRLKRKQAQLKDESKIRCDQSTARRICEIVPIESVPVKCIQVDSADHCYLAGGAFITTHNTEMLNNLHGSVIEQSPRNILVVYPTLDSAKKWSKQFFEPMRKTTAAIARLIKDRRSRESHNTILSKEFPGGSISAIGANSPSGFRQVQAPVVTCDEIDAMDDGDEG